MDIEAGEYIRTDEGIIQKCTDTDNNYIYSDGILSYSFQGDIKIPNSYIDKTRIIRHSKNIIDLIKAGDYVNGSMVYEKLEDGRVHIMGGLLLDNKDIKTILTHEQYEQNCYRLEE